MSILYIDILQNATVKQHLQNENCYYNSINFTVYMTRENILPVDDLGLFFFVT